MSLDLGQNPIVACIVEGKAEVAVIELLLTELAPYNVGYKLST